MFDCPEQLNMAEESDVDSRTVYCGNLSEKTTEDVLFELFLQAGPVESVKIPRDNEGKQSNFGFVTFKHACSVDYAIGIFVDIKLYGQHLNLKRRKAKNSYTDTQQNNHENKSYRQRIEFDSPLRDNRMIHASNMQYNMTPRGHYADTYKNEFGHQEQRYGNARRSPPRNKFHNRYDRGRSHKRYDDDKTYWPERNRKRHKR